MKPLSHVTADPTTHEKMLIFNTSTTSFNPLINSVVEYKHMIPLKIANLISGLYYVNL